jgi:hypothetical protein
MHRRLSRVTLILILACLVGLIMIGIGVATPLPPSASIQSGDWWQDGRNPRKSSFNYVESAIGRENVSQLVLDWEYSRGGAPHPAAVANGLVYFAHGSGIAVFPLRCGTGGIACSPLWETDESTGDIVVAGDHVFTTSGSDVLGYLALGCGLPVCEPVMSLFLGGQAAQTLTGAGDVLVADTDSEAGFPGMYVWDLSRCSDDPCPAVWKAELGQRSPGSVAVARGSIYVGTDQGLEVYDRAGCGADLCEPNWVGPLNVFHASTMPTVAHGFVYLMTSGLGPALSAFPAAGCGERTCEPSWQANIDTAIGTRESLAVAYGRVYVRGFGQIEAFRARGCGVALCDPLWVGDTSGDYLEPPSVANGVVYIGSSDTSGGTNSVINAFSTECDQAECQPLFVLPIKGEGDHEGFVSGGKLVVTSGGPGNLSVYGLPQAISPSRRGSTF